MEGDSMYLRLRRDDNDCFEWPPWEDLSRKQRESIERKWNYLLANAADGFVVYVTEVLDGDA